VTFAVPLQKKPLTKFATAASSSSLWPRAKGGMKACSTGSGAFEPASRIAIRLVALGSLTVRLPIKGGRPVISHKRARVLCPTFDLIVSWHYRGWTGDWFTPSNAIG
jgi:hypothetical protein